MVSSREVLSAFKASHGLLKPRNIQSVTRLCETPRAPVLLTTRAQSKVALKKYRRSGKPMPIRKRNNVFVNFEEALPPLSLLNLAARSGALPVEPLKALEILRQYQESWNKESGGDWQAHFVRKHEITPAVLVTLAKILDRCPYRMQKRLALEVMITASDLGEASATLDLVEASIRSKSPDFPQYVQPRQRLEELVRKHDDRDAMTVLGRVKLAKGDRREALALFRKATQGPPARLDFDRAAQALLNEGRLLQDLNDKKGAEAAFRKAATELDDPTAYFHISQLEEHDSSQQRAYLMKAASSGVMEACHALGLLELERLENQPVKPKTFGEYGMAREWFQVAAADGFGPSMVSLALMLRDVGDGATGMKWLERAESVPQVEKQARSLMAQWESEKVGMS